MKDIQKNIPNLKIPIKQVGITDLKLPISISQQKGSYQNTIANVDVFVNLNMNAKGIHMSRLIEGAHDSLMTILNENVIKKIIDNILIESDASRAEICYKFPYFIEKEAPISKKKGLIPYNIETKFITTNKKEYRTFISIKVISTSLCPCSKEISKYGAHNQRSIITFAGKYNSNIRLWFEEIIDIIEKNSSCEIYSILKRPDEKFVTEKAYENPNFVEDSSRKIYKEFLEKNLFSWFEVKVMNEESIHCHNACAILTHGEK